MADSRVVTLVCERSLLRDVLVGSWLKSSVHILIIVLSSDTTHQMLVAHVTLLFHHCKYQCLCHQPRAETIGMDLASMHKLSQNRKVGL